MFTSPSIGGTLCRPGSAGRALHLASPRLEHVADPSSDGGARLGDLGTETPGRFVDRLDAGADLQSGVSDKPHWSSGELLVTQNLCTTLVVLPHHMLIW